ncbi:MAG: OmpA family protein [Gelidibacter sp.]
MKKVLFFILSLTFYSVFSQNLVLNPSFEDYKYCPNAISCFNNNVTNWSTPTLGSTDYFNSCSTFFGFSNYIGNQKARTGKGYAGIYVYAYPNYREYIQGKLKETLIKGKTYQITFYISLADNSNHSIKDLGIFMTSSKRFNNQSDKTINAKRISKKVLGFAYVPFFSKESYSNKKEWIKMTSIYNASGFENFFIIGNFNNNSSSKIEKLEKSKYEDFSYYYIDDVSIEPIEKVESKEILLNDETVETALERNKIYTFKNVLFNFDKSILLEVSKIELNKLSKYLKDNSKLNIEIYGHTDNIGTKKRNEELSQERAESVSKYLILQGLDVSRIHWFGFGSSQPVSTNETEEGRAQNRRVEFKLIEN